MSSEEKRKRHSDLTRKYGDSWIWGIYFILLIVSIVESYSASSQIVAGRSVYSPIINQGGFLLLGLGIIVAMSRIKYNNTYLLTGLIPLLWFVSVGGLLYVMVAGKVVNGAARAVYIMGFSVQPAELAKLSVVTMLAFILARSQKNNDVSMWGLVASVIVVAVFGLLMLRDGLTNTALLMGISLSMMVVGGISWRRIIIVMAMFGIVVAAVYKVKSYNDSHDTVVQTNQTFAAGADDKEGKVDRTKMRGDRIDKWLHSDSLIYEQVSDDNAQEMFSRMAQAHGGVTGVTPGHSRECSRLPLAFSDYIYSIIVEETGLVGGIIVLMLYFALMSRAAIIASRCSRSLPALLIMGMAAMITCQALCHMAINVGAMPVSGQPLPLISKGGTSILVTSVAFGLMICISRSVANGDDRRNNKKKKENEGDAEIAAEALDEVTNPSQYLRNEWK
ncbi:MAG: FtsW/RodA/SpoVE family cell cycle protein [Bacteroidales bacterium]|nr:FtsW/RodA/SpoVE family cell cycle protein [Bacteroidales bacterium]MDY3911924.1 FtsW/RodA/SpoVE family cell cycle protein [Sodaliphilus sp.]